MVAKGKAVGALGAGGGVGGGTSLFTPPEDQSKAVARNSKLGAHHSAAGVLPDLQRLLLLLSFDPLKGLSAFPSLRHSFPHSVPE